MDEYVIVNKSDLTSMANTIRDALGSSDSIAVGDLTSKLIESIEAGSGGGVITGTFTVAADTTANYLDYSPQSVDEWPSWLIVIAEKDANTVYSSFNGLWAEQVVYSNVSVDRHNYFNYRYSYILYGYNEGVDKYYTPYLGSGNISIAVKISCNPSGFNSPFLAGVTYRYYMGFG